MKIIFEDKNVTIFFMDYRISIRLGLVDWFSNLYFGQDSNFYCFQIILFWIIFEIHILKG